MKFAKFNHELGKACVLSSVSILVAVFVSNKITGTEIDQTDFLFCVGAGFLLLLLGALLLVDRDQKHLPGKWKRVKVRKDTTIHIQEEQ